MLVNYTYLRALTGLLRFRFLKIVFVFHDVTLLDKIVISRPLLEGCLVSANPSILPSSLSQVIKHKRCMMLAVLTLWLHNSWMLKCLHNLSPRPAGVSYDVPDSGIIKVGDDVVKSPPEFH